MWLLRTLDDFALGKDYAYDASVRPPPVELVASGANLGYRCGVNTVI